MMTLLRNDIAEAWSWPQQLRHKCNLWTNFDTGARDAKVFFDDPQRSVARGGPI